MANTRKELVFFLNLGQPSLANHPVSDFPHQLMMIASATYFSWKETTSSTRFYVSESESEVSEKGWGQFIFQTIRQTMVHFPLSLFLLSHNVAADLKK